MPFFLWLSFWFPQMFYCSYHFWLYFCCHCFFGFFHFKILAFFFFLFFFFFSSCPKIFYFYLFIKLFSSPASTCFLSLSVEMCSFFPFFVEGWINNLHFCHLGIINKLFCISNKSSAMNKVHRKFFITFTNVIMFKNIIIIYEKKYLAKVLPPLFSQKCLAFFYFSLFRHFKINFACVQFSFYKIFLLKWLPIFQFLLLFLPLSFYIFFHQFHYHFSILGTHRELFLYRQFQYHFLV